MTGTSNFAWSGEVVVVCVCWCVLQEERKEIVGRLALFHILLASRTFRNMLTISIVCRHIIILMISQWKLKMLQ